MITTTYLALVAVVAIALWRLRVRGRRAGADRHGAAPTAAAWVRAALAGVSGPDDDLVERMAATLVADTTTFGSSYAIPGHLGAELPPGVFAAASAARPQLTAEVLDRYQDLMVDRCRRLGRPDFVLPADYTLRLVLGCGSEELLLASFEPIVDVRDAAAPPRRTPLPAGSRGPDEGGTRTRVRRLTAVDADDAGATVVLLSVDGAPREQRRLDATTPIVAVGRGADVDLRCPEDAHEVSRRHAELTLTRHGVHVTDLGSANGTWLEREDDTSPSLTPGVAEPLRPGDVVWLDQPRRVTVTLL